ncbi:MAG: DUF1800 domain-containing protein [Saprospiraceae bacterium]|nr:DUF1800 domain-containing protein [Saprospiraceae bacterium]
MDRRATLAAFIGRSDSKQKRQQRRAAAPINSSLSPYAGPWGWEQAAHLLRRATFGPTKTMIETAVQNGLNGTLTQLFADQPLPAPPVNPNNATDPNVPIGETWINAPYSATVNLVGYRNQSLRGWTMGLMLNEGISIREKMTLFWHNHFAVRQITDPKFLYKYITLLRSSALGNFRQLVKDVTIDPTMLRFLNGNQSTRNAPNENYARELLELFTIGKGPAAGPGDYTNYTETDVEQMARVLTGWRDRGFNTQNPDIAVESFFTLGRHDLGNKQLSHRFDNAVIPNMAENEYAHLVDVIFQKDEVARFICRKLYRWFVYYDIDAATEVNIIEPMAQLLIANNYNIQPAMAALLGSEHFFDILNVGPMIKSPIDFVVGAFRQFSIPFPTQLLRYYNAWFQFFRFSIPMQMEYFNPPDVAGWKAYYQEPGYYRTWINAATLAPRSAFTNQLATTGYVYNTVRYLIDVLTLVDTVSDPFDPVVVIREFSELLYPQPLAQNQLDYLKEVLLPGLPDFEWTIEYNDYKANPDNANLRQAVETKLRNLVRAMLSMPEYYLS